MVGLRFAAAADAVGLEPRVTAHSGRVSLVSEPTSRDVRRPCQAPDGSDTASCQFKFSMGAQTNQ